MGSFYEETKKSIETENQHPWWAAANDRYYARKWSRDCFMFAWGGVFISSLPLIPLLYFHTPIAVIFSLVLFLISGWWTIRRFIESKMFWDL